jgi:hypothetical protein
MTRRTLVDTAVILAHIVACLWLLKGCHDLQVARASCKGPWCVAGER